MTTLTTIQLQHKVTTSVQDCYNLVKNKKHCKAVINYTYSKEKWQYKD